MLPSIAYFCCCLSTRKGTLFVAMAKSPPSISQMSADKATEQASLLGDTKTTPPGVIKPIYSKIILVTFGLAAVAALITLIVIASTRSKGDNTPNVSTCEFSVPFKNWVNYNLEGTDATCPTTGTPFACNTTTDCLALSPLCYPGAPKNQFSCVNHQCNVYTATLPTLVSPGGVCDRTTPYSTCALCTSGDCYGVALCVQNSDCSNSKLKYQLECHENGHSVQE